MSDYVWTWGECQVCNWEGLVTKVKNPNPRAAEQGLDLEVSACKVCLDSHNFNCYCYPRQSPDLREVIENGVWLTHQLLDALAGKSVPGETVVPLETYLYRLLRVPLEAGLHIRRGSIAGGQQRWFCELWMPMTEENYSFTGEDANLETAIRIAVVKYRGRD